MILFFINLEKKIHFWRLPVNNGMVSELKCDQNSVRKSSWLQLKYFSPTIAEGKTFVLVFCNSELDSTQLFTVAKD